MAARRIVKRYKGEKPEPVPDIDLFVDYDKFMETSHSCVASDCRNNGNIIKIKKHAYECKISRAVHTCSSTERCKYAVPNTNGFISCPISGIIFFRPHSCVDLRCRDTGAIQNAGHGVFKCTISGVTHTCTFDDNCKITGVVNTIDGPVCYFSNAPLKIDVDYTAGNAPLRDDADDADDGGGFVSNVDCIEEAANTKRTARSYSSKSNHSTKQSRNMDEMQVKASIETVVKELIYDAKNRERVNRLNEADLFKKSKTSVYQRYKLAKTTTILPTMWELNGIIEQERNKKLILIIEPIDKKKLAYYVDILFALWDILATHMAKCSAKQKTFPVDIYVVGALYMLAAPMINDSQGTQNDSYLAMRLPSEQDLIKMGAKKFNVACISKGRRYINDIVCQMTKEEKKKEFAAICKIHFSENPHQLNDIKENRVPFIPFSQLFF